jgi:hypothetical protein
VAMLDDPLAPRVAVRVIHHSKHRTHDVPCPLQPVRCLLGGSLWWPRRVTVAKQR